MVIIKEIDAKWECKGKLQQECLDNQKFMARFDELYVDLANAKFKTYEMITMLNEIWIARWLGPIMFLSGMETAKKSIKDKVALDN